MAIMEKPIKGYICLVILMFIVTNVLSIFISPFIPKGDYAVCILNIICTIALLLVYKRLGHVNLKKMLELKNFKKGLILLAPMLIYYIINIIGINNFITIDRIIPAITLAFSIGLIEETMFRAIPLTHFMKTWTNRDQIAPALIITSVVFGGVHLLNALAGADPNHTIIQFIYCMGIGALFAATYLRTGNIWPLVIGHGTLDLTALLESHINSTGGILVVAPQISVMDIVGVIIAIAFIVVAFYYIRPSKRDEIVQLWNEKFYN